MEYGLGSRVLIRGTLGILVWFGVSFFGRRAVFRRLLGDEGGFVLGLVHLSCDRVELVRLILRRKAVRGAVIVVGDELAVGRALPG